jgi:hypothetical protein
MLPFTKGTAISVTGQGTFQGGSTEYRQMDRQCRKVYLDKVAAATGVDDREELQVCTSQAYSARAAHTLMPCCVFSSPGLTIATVSMCRCSRLHRISLVLLEPYCVWFTPVLRAPLHASCRLLHRSAASQS